MQFSLDARLFVLAAIASLSTLGHAQAPPPTHMAQASPAVELTYDYIHTNGPPNSCGCFNINGGGAAFVYPLRSSAVGIVAKLGVGSASGISTSNLGVTLFTYTVGARYSPAWRYAKWHPYGEIQVGGAHAGGSLLTAPNPAGSSNSSAFAGSLGGGIDVALNPRFSLKLADAQYLATTFANGSTDHQNNLRISAGLVIHLGKANR